MDRPRRRSSALCLAMLFTVASTAVAQESPDLLADVRTALGTGRWDAMKGALRIEGDFSSSSASGPIEILIDASGRFVRRIDGAVRLLEGFDGATAWARDWMSTPRVLELGDREAALFATLMLTPHWTVEGGPFAVEPLPPAESRPAGALRVRLREGLMEGTVAVHPDSALPLSVSSGTGEGAETTTFADWREAAGIRLPHEVTVTRKSGTDRLVVRRVTGPLPPDGEALRPRLEPPGDTTFSPGAPVEIPARRVRAGNLLVKARLDGGEPGWFIVDTGAGATVVSKEAAERLQGEAVGSVSAVGTGGSVPSRILRARSLEVGPMTIRSPVLVEIDLGFLKPHFEVAVAGILGFDVWARALVEIDPAKPGIVLRDPAAAPAVAPGSVPLVLSARLPCVKARFQGDHEALFMIDTGAGQTTATFHAGAARTFGIPGDRPWKRRFAGGVGGLTSHGDVEIAWFEVGGHRFETPRVGFALKPRGRREEEHAAGSIGARFLEPFVLVLDYRNRRLTLRPRE